VLYISNAIESLNSAIHSLVKTRKAFSNDKAVMRIIYLATAAAAEKWIMSIGN
jgi:putative transposase